MQEVRVPQHVQFCPIKLLMRPAQIERESARNKAPQTTINLRISEIAREKRAVKELFIKFIPKSPNPYMTENPEISLVIPLYNEEENLACPLPGTGLCTQ